MGVVHEAVEDGVGQGRLADQLVPAVHRHLAGDQGRPAAIALLHDLQQVAALPGVTSVKLVEIRVRREVAIGQAARGGIWIGSAVSVAASSAMASTCM